MRNEYPEGVTSTAEYWANQQFAALPSATTEEDRLLSLERKLEAMRAANAEWAGSHSQEEVQGMQSQVSALQAEMQAAEEDRFFTEWTVQVTTMRREQWNAWVRARKGNSISGLAVATKERQQGWTLTSLKRAIKLHRLV